MPAGESDDENCSAYSDRDQRKFAAGSGDGSGTGGGNLRVAIGWDLGALQRRRNCSRAGGERGGVRSGDYSRFRRNVGSGHNSGLRRNGGDWNYARLRRNWGWGG